MQQKIMVDQELIKKHLKMGIKPYFIAKIQKIPISVVKGIQAGKDRPWFKRRGKIKKLEMCEHCGIRKKTGRFLCQNCFEKNSGSVGDDEFKINF